MILTIPELITISSPALIAASLALLTILIVGPSIITSEFPQIPYPKILLSFTSWFILSTPSPINRACNPCITSIPVNLPLYTLMVLFPFTIKSTMPLFGRTSALSKNILESKYKPFSRL